MFDIQQAIKEAELCAKYSKGFTEERDAVWVNAQDDTRKEISVFTGINRLNREGFAWYEGNKWFVITSGHANSHLGCDNFNNADFPSDFKGIYVRGKEQGGMELSYLYWNKLGINENSTVIIGPEVRAGTCDLGSITAERLVIFSGLKDFYFSGKINNLDIVFPKGVKAIKGNGAIIRYVRGSYIKEYNAEFIALAVSLPEKILPEFMGISEADDSIVRYTQEDIVEAVGLPLKRIAKEYGFLLNQGFHPCFIACGAVRKELQYAGIPFPNADAVKFIGADEEKIRKYFENMKRAREKKGLPFFGRR